MDSWRIQGLEPKAQRRDPMTAADASFDANVVAHCLALGGDDWIIRIAQYETKAPKPWNAGAR